MQIATILSLVVLLISCLSFTIQGLGPTRSPDSGDVVGSAPVDSSSLSPTLSDPPIPAPVSGISEDKDPRKRTYVSPAPAPEKEEYDQESGDTSAIYPPPEEMGSATVKCCAVRDEFVDCQYYISLLRHTDGYIRKCVKRETTQECLDSIKKGEADLINLEAGLAYIAFLNYSMKAIANEVYCNHAESFDVVAVVNRKACKEKDGVSLTDFRGRKSCHGDYSTATGWNYPVNHLKQLVESKNLNDREIVTGFFSEVCAPSEFEGMGVCSGCGNDSASCNSNSLYSGHSGAFRCLTEELGDIAFVKADTAMFYSSEGQHNQTWSTKSIRDFMWGHCFGIFVHKGVAEKSMVILELVLCFFAIRFGTVPANVIMASNSISSKKKLVVLQTLLNATWIDALYTQKNGASHLLSSSTQGLAVVKKLTRPYLGLSASISQSIQESNTKKDETIPSTVTSVSDVYSPSLSCDQHPWIVTVLSILIGLVFPAFFPLSK
ncbi:hypothetical protein HHK36_019155 [Tetracentron sinense]|uniref:Transferrin-like domain-containing protein n=1 Tax=Tetracentron sinense TaxID=13715 RepID=A0A834Z1R0_TETSI|nr:hypothetical protein HHK36_019155 [Tetracentron sinense]